LVLACLILSYLSVKPVLGANEKFLVITPEVKFYLKIGQNDTKMVNLYGLKNATNLEIRATDLVDSNSGNIITSNNVSLNNNPGIYDTVINEGERKHIPVSLTGKDPGIYKGSILVTQNTGINNTTTTPIKLESEIVNPPIWGEIISIFLLGFSVSAGIWLLRSYITLVDRFGGVIAAVKDIYVDFDVFVPIITNSEYYLFMRDFRLAQLYDVMVKSNIDAGEKRLEQARGIYERMMDKENFKSEAISAIMQVKGYASVSDYLKDVRLDALSFRDRVKPKPRDDDLNDLEFYLYDYLTRKRLKRIFVFNSTAIILGLFISVGTLLQQNFSDGIFSEYWIRFVVILGIGIGTDTVKQVLERITN
jgi:hypothetical protein